MTLADTVVLEDLLAAAPGFAAALPTLLRQRLAAALLAASAASVDYLENQPALAHLLVGLYHQLTPETTDRVIPERAAAWLLGAGFPAPDLPDAYARLVGMFVESQKVG